MDTRERPQWSPQNITNHQRHSSNRSPLALLHRIHSQKVGWNFFQLSSTSSWPTELPTRSRSPSQTHPRRRQQSQRALRPVGSPGFMSNNQLFKPRLFTDNLLTVQLFILRPRPGASHKLMKSNRALLGRETTHITPWRQTHLLWLILCRTMSIQVYNWTISVWKITSTDAFSFFCLYVCNLLTATCWTNAMQLTVLQSETNKKKHMLVRDQCVKLQHNAPPESCAGLFNGQ